MLNRRTMLAVSLLAIAPGIALAQAPTIGDPLPSWNDSPVRHSIIDFVTRVTTDGSPDFVPPVNQRWVADMGLPGPDAGKGGKHLLLPPDYKGQVPTSGYYVHRASSNRQIIGARSLPVNGDVKGAKERLKAIKVYPLNSTPGWSEPQWLDVTGKTQDTTPVQWEDSLAFWEMLHKTVDSEPSYAGYHNYYGELAALGIEKGKPFAPDARMKRILAEAARVGTRRCACNRSAIAVPIGSSGPTVNGNGQACASRTATSTRAIASTSRSRPHSSGCGRTLASAALLS